MMTEDEAKNAWCPLARSRSNESDAAINRELGGFGTPDVDCMCIGCACMAWRWVREPDPTDDHPFSEKFIAVRGYCGAFGRAT